MPDLPDDDPLAQFLTNLVIKAKGTVTNPPATIEASAQASGTVTNPEGEA